MLSKKERQLFEGWLYRRHRCFDYPWYQAPLAAAGAAMILGGFAFAQGWLTVAGSLAWCLAFYLVTRVRLNDRKAWRVPVAGYAIERIAAVCSDETKATLERFRAKAHDGVLRFSHLDEVLTEDEFVNACGRNADLAGQQAAALANA